MTPGAAVEEDAKSEEEKAEKESLEKEGAEQAAEGKRQNNNYISRTSLEWGQCPG